MAGGVAHEINTPLTTVSFLSGQLWENLSKEKSLNAQLYQPLLELLDKTTE